MKYIAITTFNKPYYDNMAHKMVETYLKFWPKDIPLYVYTEDMKLPVQAENLKELDIYENCPGLKEFLDWRGDHFTRGMAFKTYSFISAFKNIECDVIIYLDADSVTYKTITREFLDSLLPNKELTAYMGVTMNKGKWQGNETENAETCIYLFNKQHAGAKQFMDHYEYIYESREIDDRQRFKKPHDTWAFTECVQRALANGHLINDLHPTRKAHSPLKETVLGDYFRHFKGARKLDNNIDSYVDELTTTGVDNKQKIKRADNPLKDIEKKKRFFRTRNG